MRTSLEAMNASAALLHRSILTEALDERTAQLAAPLPRTRQSNMLSVLVFRLRREWFALSASLCRQVISPMAAHTLPHRSNGTLLGVVNVRGQMLLKVSLLEVLGLPFAASDSDCTEPVSGHGLKGGAAAKAYPRMVVIEQALPSGGSDVWVFEVDELDGIHPIELNALESPAAGVQMSASACTRRVFLWQNRRVSLLDDTQLINTLRQRAL